MNAIEKRSNPILSYSERQKLRKRIDLCKRSMAGGFGVPDGRGKGDETVVMPLRRRQYIENNFTFNAVDSGLTMREMRQAQRLLDQGSPDSLSSAKRGTLERRAKVIAEEIRSEMSPQSLNGLKSKDADFQKAVSAALREHSPDFKKKAAEYKSIMRQIDPDNPDSSSIERLRPQ